MQGYFHGGRGWIRTIEAYATDLQSAPFGHSGTRPYEIGAGGRTRTPDLLITNQLLYQLSYTSIKNGRGDRTRTCGILVPNQALYQTELRPGAATIINCLFQPVHYSTWIQVCQAFFFVADNIFRQTV